MVDALFGDPNVDPVIEALSTVKGWPSDQVVDEEFVRSLQAEYPGVDLVAAIGDWKVWLLDNQQVYGKKVNWRSRFRTWVKNGVLYGRERRERRGTAVDRGRIGGSGSPAGRGSTRPGSVEAFGPSRGLDDW